MVSTAGQIACVNLENAYINVGYSSYFVGTLVGFNDFGHISNCRSTGTVIGGEDIGGLVGYCWEGKIENSCSTADVTGGWDVGGLVGCNSAAVIINCYATGTVTGDVYVGGLVGDNGDSVINCYSAGVISGSEDVGGLIGAGGHAASSFWDIEKSGITTSAGGSGKTTNQMKSKNTFLGWNGCGEIWTIDDGSDYPILAWQNKPGSPLPSHELSDLLEGTGTPADPYRIQTAQQLNLVGLFACEWNKYFELDADIDISDLYDARFNIIAPGYTYSFTGTFDGRGHTISNFSWTSSHERNIGFFGTVDEGAHVMNLGLLHVEITTDTYPAGALAGINSGLITNCYSTGTVTADRFNGGLVGSNYGTIIRCYSACNVSGAYRTGGLAGENLFGATITKSYSLGQVESGIEVGGLVGENYQANISDCYSNSSVIGIRSLGGLVGLNWGNGTILNCYSTGSVSGSHDLGGLIGKNYAFVISSFWDTDTSGKLYSAGGTGKTTIEMMQQDTFQSVGWDFETPIWYIDDGNDYPSLAWELAPDVPYLQPEPEVTLGTSNTIYWDAVADTNGYFAECAEDADFTIIFADTGWIADTNCTFEGLETGWTYFYRVKAINELGFESEWSNIELSTQVTLAEAVEETLDANSLVNENMQNALTNKINAVMNMIDAGHYAQAINKLENDILQKTDGCAETGAPDKNDWITTCEQQDQIYPLIIEMIDYLEGLI